MSLTTRIFVGNIPYDFDENDLVETLEMVGPVKDIEIKLDENTNKPKGFGFCNYLDVYSRKSALKNLKNIEYNGRQLRINNADIDKNLIHSEESFRSLKDLVFTNKDIPKDLNLLRPEQKTLLLSTCRILQEKFPTQFKSMLYNQNIEFLEDFLKLLNQKPNK